MTTLPMYLSLPTSRVHYYTFEQSIPNSGWHLSYFLSLDDMKRKIESTSHREYDKDEFKQRDFLFECVTQGKDLYRREDVVFYRLMFGINGKKMPEGWEELQKEMQRIQGWGTTEIDYE